MLGQNNSAHASSESNDGMDAVFFWMDTRTRQLTCANARMCLLVLSSDRDQVDTITADRTGLGYSDTKDDTVWKNITIPLTQDTIVLAATDGIIDQIGGHKNIAFGKQRIRNIVLAQRHVAMKALADTLMKQQHAYQGSHRRRDDLTVFGFRLQGAENPHQEHYG